VSSMLNNDKLGVFVFPTENLVLFLIVQKHGKPFFTYE